MIAGPPARDLVLPASAGDAELCLPEARDFLSGPCAALAPAGAPPLRSAELLFARWKPGVSRTALWRVALGDGTHKLVGQKLFKSDKARHLAGRVRIDERLAELCHPLGVRHVDAQAGRLVWTFPADRVLSGLPRLLDRGRTKRWIASAGLVPGGTLHRRGIGAQLLRYKPERRAVWRLDLAVDGESEPRRLAARVLPPEEAERVVAARAALPLALDDALAPRFLAAEAARGLLLEEWCDVVSATSESFEWAGAAGELLAQLHALPLPDGIPPSPLVALAEIPPLFAVGADLAAAARALGDPPVGESRAWIHGDLHPDQIARRLDGAGFLLLDLDRLGAGDPLRDLANWIADELACRPHQDLAACAAALLEGYRRGGGRVPSTADLAPHVVAALVRRAAAAVRRLEAGAVERARAILACAAEVARARSSAP